MTNRVSTYNLDLIVPADLIGEVIKLIQNEGTLVRVTPNTGNGHTQQRPYTPPADPTQKSREARDVVYATLNGAGEVQRKIITKALKAKGYSTRSVGPICTMLQRDGVIFSPRRGYWQIKGAT